MDDVLELRQGLRDVLEALCRVCVDGWPASVREVMAECGLASTESVHTRLGELEALGLVARSPRRPSRSGWKPVPPA